MGQVDMHQAEKDAKALYKAGEGRFGTDEAAIIQILSTRSAAQLNASFHIYKQMHGHDIEKVWGTLSPSPTMWLLIEDMPCFLSASYSATLHLISYICYRQ